MLVLREMHSKVGFPRFLIHCFIPLGCFWYIIFNFYFRFYWRPTRETVWWIISKYGQKFTPTRSTHENFCAYVYCIGLAQVFECWPSKIQCFAGNEDNGNKVILIHRQTKWKHGAHCDRMQQLGWPDPKTNAQVIWYMHCPSSIFWGEPGNLIVARHRNLYHICSGVLPASGFESGLIMGQSTTTLLDYNKKYSIIDLIVLNIVIPKYQGQIKSNR